jgi:hypothetical protein
MPLDLDAPGVAQMLATRIKTEIDAYCQRAYDDGPRTHLGASLINHECARYLWFTFRWIDHKVHEGRMLRLFNRGHREEDRFIEWYKGIGFTVESHDADGNQFRISAVGGHYGGSQDGQMQFPPHWDVHEPMVLAEYKTKGTGSGFSKLKENGVRVENPQHYGQMCSYGAAKGFRYAVYNAINKNDDDLHVEIVKLDLNYGNELCRKAGEIITAPTAPPRCASQPTYRGCKYCDFLDVCWNKKPSLVNCRSCVNARPIDNGQWYCNLYSPGANHAPIPADTIKTGCTSHSPIFRG